MKTFRIFEEVVKRRKIISVHCDKCNKEIPTRNAWDLNDFTLERNKGHIWPDGGGSGKEWKVEDLCDDCLEDLFALLISWGVTIKEREWDS